MRRFTSWFSTARRRKPSNGSRTIGYSGRRLMSEPLEERILLTTAAVGSFTRLQATSEGYDVRTYLDVKAIANGDENPEPPTVSYREMNGDILVRDYLERSASDSGATAYAYAKSAGFILTDVGNQTPVPSVSIEAVDIGSAIQSAGEAHATTRGSGSINGKFVYDDEDAPAGDKLFYGAVYLIGLGGGTASGNFSAWDIRQQPNIGIAVNGTPVVSISVYGSANSGGNGLPLIDGHHYTITVSAYGKDPYSFESTGANLYVNAIIPIHDGDVVTIAGGVGPSGGASGSNYPSFIDAVEYPDDSSAQLNFVQNVAGYGFVFNANNPPNDLPPIWDGGEDDGPPELFDDDDNPGDDPGDNDPVAPGDLNGDGKVDNEDLLLWAEIVKSAILNDTKPLIVTTEEDVVDGDLSFYDLSLREALTLAATTAYAGEDTIVFAKWVDEIVLSSPLSIAAGNDVHIAGPGADNLTIDGDGNDRLFNISSGVDATVSGMTLTGGQSTGGGGAIYSSGNLVLHSVIVSDNENNTAGGGVYVDNGTLEVYSSTFDNNRVVGSTGHERGGAIAGAFPAGVSLIIEDSTFSNNNGDQSGGAIAFNANSVSSVIANVTNSTFSGNSAWIGGAICTQYATATVNLVNSTITNNTATGWLGGGLFKAHGAAIITANNTIIAQNLATDPTYASQRDVAGAMSSSTYNLIGMAGTSGLSNSNGNQVGTSTELNAKLAPLGDYGGKTKTHALLLTSPAIDKGSDSIALSHDQRGFAREYDLPDSNGADGYRDVGAYEAGDSTILTVQTEVDRLNSPSNPDDLSLREALALSASLAGSEEIIFDASLFAAGPATIALTYDGSDSGTTPDVLTIAGDVKVRGPGADKLTITAQDSYGTGVFQVNSSVTATLSGLHITGGYALYGGGVNSQGNLTVDGCQIDENYAITFGGGIYRSAGTLTVLNSSIANNAAGYEGGGLFLDGPGAASIINSTISTNDGGYDGGGILNYAAALTVTNSTITANTASLDGGGIYGYVITRLNNTIVSGNSSPGADDFYGTLHSSSSHNWVGGDARLAPLANYGGPTLTHALLYNSPAIDAGSNTIAEGLDLTFDQRGRSRIEDVNWDSDSSEVIDIGAVEMAFDEYLT